MAMRNGLYFHGLTMKEKYKHSEEATNAINEILGYVSAEMDESDVEWVEKNYSDVFKRK